MLNPNSGIVCNDQLSCDWKYWAKFCLYPRGCLFEESKGREMLYDYVLSYEVNGERKLASEKEVPHIHAAIAEVRKVEPEAHMFIVLSKLASRRASVSGIQELPSRTAAPVR